MRHAPHPLLRELLIAAAVGGPCLGVVMATNHTASTALILAHAVLLLCLVPLLSFRALKYLELVRNTSNDLWLSLFVRLLAVLAGTLLTLLILRATTGISLSTLVAAPLFAALLPVCLAYLLVASIEHGSRVRERAALLEVAGMGAREAALIARIRPHFLFNALTCIEELTVDDPMRARMAVQALARLLRGVLHASSTLSSTLEQELPLVEDYLGIEQIRFGARLALVLEIDPRTRQCKVPATILLTLVENAIKHGVESTLAASQIRVQTSLGDDGRLRVRISSPAGRAAVRSATQGSGYGLADIRERLALLHAQEASMTLEEREGEFHVELCLPT